jgi:hypothetical protein
MWLRDLLPAAIPDIRIMTFGYNARFKNFTAQQDLRSISLKLLAELVDLRTTEDVSEGPIFSNIMLTGHQGEIPAYRLCLPQPGGNCSEEGSWPLFDFIANEYLAAVKGAVDRLHSGARARPRGCIWNLISW